MVINVTRWSPDTCTCVVEYSWDDSVSQDQRQHNLSNVVQRCPAHSSLSDSSIFSTLLDENPRKNAALQNSLDNGPSTLYDIIDGTRQLKPNLKYNFSWSGTPPNRILNTTFSGVNLTIQQKNTIQSAHNQKFGTGKVLVA